ncbi:MotA/TolQ/ExbB proton channel family protein [Neptunomonas japonica]|uniref:Flagellar motor protein MotA n=1 Tax=Neptunomonas japonica JAMM 1380 TaxID=1441457 RepID=A0A7R6SWV5_9GAMM|nr:MotA/TolQ/ExbB proton channel family protein [Neptunomonas japonica]BBB30865.1 flagellar motor protein MotA [Neptunomonas japonica JAMM 1380]
MVHGIVLGALHQFVDLLLYPVLAALALAVMMTLWELGLMIAERFITLSLYAKGCDQRFGHYANRRLERTDLLARGGPILGLMGTLIPLGPGLTALSAGDIDILATALTVAFDTTVVGLLVGLFAYCISRIRRRWYEHTWAQLTQSSHHEAA